MKKITRSINITVVKAVYADLNTMTVTEKEVKVIGDNNKEIEKQLHAEAAKSGLSFVAEKSRTTTNELYEMSEAEFVEHGKHIGSGRLAEK